jgi:PKD repeat protein
VTTKSRYIRASCITAALVFIAFAALACGHGGASLTPKVAAQPAYLDMNEALAELDALPAPAGVDAALFAQLKSTFAALLRTQGKIASTPPRQAINDLDIIPGTAGAMPRATWSSDFFIGDGDQNGVVGISDITPVAMWFHQSVTNAPLSKVADYNRNGTVEISDITPLAMNFAHRATEFAIETGPTATGPFTERAAVLWDGQLPDKNVNGFAAFEYELALADFAGGAGTWVRAVPRDADSVEGEPSAALFALYPNIAPTASLAGNPTSGEAPLEVVFDATGSSDSDGTITSYDYDWDSDGTYDLLDGGTSPSHIYDVEGDYNAALRVTDNLGATATASLPVSVTPPSGNLPPVAVLTADPLSGDAPLLVDFDASGSYDPDNNVPPNNGIELYEWDWDSDGVYDLSGMSPTAQYTFNLPSAIGYTVTVRVTDSVGATATDNVIVQVNSASSPPAIVSVSPLAGEEGTAVILTATVTGTPPFDYSFDMTAPASWATPDYVSDSGSAVEASVTLGTPGIYMLTVNVSNAFGSDNRMEAFVINPAGSEWDIYPVDATNSPTYSSLAIIAAPPTAPAPGAA